MTAPSILATRRSRAQTPPIWFGGNMPIARLGLILNLLVPLALLIWDAHLQKLGPDPVNFAIHTTGIVAVIYLLLSLMVTPLRMITGWSWIVQFRRSLGVYAFYYACCHLSIYFWWDRQHSVSSTFYEITHRYYLLIGFTSLCLMAPLWATSFNAAIRRMGGLSWKRLHQLAYLAAILACCHFYLQSKADKRLPDVFIAILTGLLLWRAVAFIVRRARAPVKTAANSRGLSAGTSPATEKLRFWKGNLKVVGMFAETSTVRTFRLAPANGAPLPFIYRAGQFLSLSAEIDGKRITRSYTIASPPTRDAYIELTIKREDQGRVSSFLHDMLQTGQSVAISAPGGQFIFDTAEAPGTHGRILLIAGGVGITPVMSILRDLTDRCWPGRIDLVFSVRGVDDVIFADELRWLTKRFPNLHVHITISRGAPADWSGLRGRVGVDLLRKAVPDFAERPTYICGPDAMAMSVRDELIAAGVNAEQISLESFTPSGAVAKDGSARPADEMPSAATATVTFVRSDRSGPLPPNKSILDTAEKLGVPIEFECRAGICGTCRCKLLSGSVTMDVRDALSETDEAEGYILACQAHAMEDVTIDA